MSRGDLTDDAQRQRLKPLLPQQRPAKSSKGGRPAEDHRRIINGMLWIDRTGAPLRDLPTRYGPWATVATRFYRWTKFGLWERILHTLPVQADARGELDAVSVSPWDQDDDPSQTEERRTGPFDCEQYRERNRVERLINWLKQFRRIVTRYETRTVNYKAMLTLAAILLWL